MATVPVRRSWTIGRFVALGRLQYSPQLAGRRVPPTFPDNRAAPPQAGYIRPRCSLARGSALGPTIVSALKGRIVIPSRAPKDEQRLGLTNLTRPCPHLTIFSFSRSKPYLPVRVSMGKADLWRIPDSIRACCNPQFLHPLLSPIHRTGQNRCWHLHTLPN